MAGSILLLAAMAFMPPLAVLWWVRNHETNDPEPVRHVLAAFAYGGSLGVFIALVLTAVFDVGFNHVAVGRTFFILVLVAPVAEELAKATGLGASRRRLLELEDGIIYGIAIGLGFAATENLVYAIDAIARGGVQGALHATFARIFSSVLLHAAATGLVGYGYGAARRRGRSWLEAIPHLLLAIGLHGVYNWAVASQAWVGFVAALALVAGLFGFLRHRIRELDALPGAD